MRAALPTMAAALALSGAASAALVAGDGVTIGARPHAPSERPDGAPATCRHQSSAGFRSSRLNLELGSFVLVGARDYTPPDVVAEFGGQKYPAIVLAGHRVTVALAGPGRRTSLLYADDHRNLPDGVRTVADGHSAVDFHACGTARADSSYDGRKATFWSGFVLTTAPRCLKLRVWVDDRRAPRRARIPLGRRCA
jgi:hypothetical protein